MMYYTYSLPSSDVTGCQDGSIRMWEWSHSQPVQSVRPPGVFAKVNRVRFTSQGNKFGACDGDGNVALWQAANASQPFFVRPQPLIMVHQTSTGKNK